MTTRLTPDVMQVCCTCKQSKEISLFHKNKISCMNCRKVERKNSYIKRKATDYSSILEYNRTFNKNNKELVQLWRKRWGDKNIDKTRLYCNSRYSRAKEGRVSWANKFFIKEAYHLASLRTKLTGMEWHVDHIIPLRNPLVCGLHVENNLQVIPAEVNHRKGNRFYE